MSTASLAQQIIDKIFAARHRPGLQEVTFTRDDLISAAAALGARRPKNLGDIVYSLRYRVPLPDSIRQTAPQGREWAIFPGGNAVYTLRTVPFNLIEPRKGLRTIRLPDATPGVISKYSLTDEQALLARVRYNRLLDVFTGLACYPLQSHLRTSITITNAIDGTPTAPPHGCAPCGDEPPKQPPHTETAGPPEPKDQPRPSKPSSDTRLNTPQPDKPSTTTPSQPHTTPSTRSPSNSVQPARQPCLQQAPTTGSAT